MTEQTTPTIQIKRDLDRKLEQVRSNQDLSDEAKRRYIAEAYEKAEAAYREVIEAQEREIQERVEKTEKDVFALSYPSTALEEDKAQIRAAHRAAYNDVYRAVASSNGPQETDTELERLLERAERTQDPELATAVYPRGHREGRAERGRFLPREEAQGEEEVGELRRSQARGRERRASHRPGAELRPGAAARARHPGPSGARG